MLVSTGSILTGLGVTGLYVGKVFEQVKQRSLYVVDERTGPTGGLGVGDDRPLNQ
jgi:polyisoprenyl-phosphate glycosyltransferase